MYVIINKTFKTCEREVKLLAASWVSYRMPVVIRDVGALCSFNNRAPPVALHLVGERGACTSGRRPCRSLRVVCK